MPVIGEIVKAKQLGYKCQRKKMIWHACESCGEERWVELWHGQPRNRLCFTCSCSRDRCEVDIDEVIRLYCEEKLGMEKIANRIGVSYPTIRKRLKDHGLMRSRKEARQLTIKRGPKHPAWKGGRFPNSRGYIKVWKPDHPRADCSGYVFEHILVWEEARGQQVPKGWVIHHVNGVKDDNRPRNLLAMPKGEHNQRLVLNNAQERVRELEAENRHLQRALEDSQMIFYISEN